MSIKMEGEKDSRRIFTRLMKRGADQEFEFDKEFWAELGSNAIAAASWEMVAEVDRIKGGNVSQQRLQRTVTHLKRR